MKDSFRKLCLLSLSTLLLPPSGARGAEDQKIPPAVQTEVDYHRDIEPILAKNCARCHGPEKQKSKFRMDTREALLKGGENGVDVVVGKSAESSLIRFVSGVDKDIKMPPEGDRLTDREIGLLRAWIDQGLKWPAKAEAEKPKGPVLRGLKGQKSWVTSVAIAPGGTILATGGGNTLVFKPGEVKLWDPATGEARATLVGHEKTVWSVAFDKEGKKLATAGYDKLVKLWDVDSGKERVTLKGHANWVTCVAFTPDGNRVVTGSEDTTVKVWDASDGKELATLKGHAGTVRALAFSPDGKTLATASFDQTVKLWDLSKSAEVATLKGHTDAVWSVAFAPNGMLASGSADGTIRLWGPAEGKEGAPYVEQGVLNGHQNWVSFVAFSPNSKRLASCGFDRTVRLWNLAIKEQVGALEDLTSTVWSLAFTADGKTLVLGFGASEVDDQSTVRFWNVPARDSRRF